MVGRKRRYSFPLSAAERTKVEYPSRVGMSIKLKSVTTQRLLTGQWTKVIELGKKEKKKSYLTYLPFADKILG